MYFKADLKFTVSLCSIVGKKKRNQPRYQTRDVRKWIVDLHLSGSSVSTISRCLKVPRSSIQTIISEYKHHGNVQPSYCMGRRWVLCHSDDQTLVWNVFMNPRSKAKHLVKMPTEAGKRVSLSTMKPVLNQHEPKGHSARKKPLLQKQHKTNLDYSCTNANRDKDLYFWRHVQWSDETKIKLFGHSDHGYI